MNQIESRVSFEMCKWNTRSHLPDLGSHRTQFFSSTLLPLDQISSTPSIKCHYANRISNLGADHRAMRAACAVRAGPLDQSVSSRQWSLVDQCYYISTSIHCILNVLLFVNVRCNDCDILAISKSESISEMSSVDFNSNNRQQNVVSLFEFNIVNDRRENCFVFISLTSNNYTVRNKLLLFHLLIKLFNYGHTNNIGMLFVFLKKSC
jgi:hypothetical protein